MAETNALGLPLVEAAQAQKHVTVNESLVRLDGLVQMRLASVGGAIAPGAPVDGEVHGVGASATGAWSGHDGELALYVNGGWVFLTPESGWQAWSEVAGTRVQFDGLEWVEGAGALSANGAGFIHRSVEIDHAVAAGASDVVPGLLPAGSIVYGVTGRVLSDIGGASTLQLGVAGSVDRYGSGIGTTSGAWLRGITGTPQTYYSDTDLLLTAQSGAFDGSGIVRLVVHFAELTLPRG